MAVPHDEERAPPPRPVRVAGTLAAICASKAEATLRLADGTAILVQIAPHDVDLSQKLLAARVVISGVARFGPTGELLVVEAEQLGPARDTDALWDRLPVPGPLPETPVERGAPKAQRAGLAGLLGTWPGDETDEELLAALKEIR